MKPIHVQQILTRANILYKNKVEEKYRKTHPDLDINKVEIMLSDETLCLIEALVQIINELK